jgi:hypothetical protein
MTSLVSSITPIAILKEWHNNHWFPRTWITLSNIIQALLPGDYRKYMREL